jgi:hypothetical protein
LAIARSVHIRIRPTDLERLRTLAQANGQSMTSLLSEAILRLEQTRKSK